MATVSYFERRSELETYFDRTAAEAWSRLTSDAPVGRIRATVRAGRDRMRATLLSWLPEDLHGHRLLDAGCGTGALAVEAARRGAKVTAIDLSPTLVKLAQERRPDDLDADALTFQVGDMTDTALGTFDHVVAMDSLIHYEGEDMVDMLSRLSARAGSGLLFTFAPLTGPLAVMHSVGRLFPRGNRAPAIEPLRETDLRRRLARAAELEGWQTERSERVVSGFYTSQAMELRRG